MQFPISFIKRKKEKKKKVSYPEELKEDIKSLEYEIFQEEERYATLPKTIYEKLAKISEKILPVDPDKKTKKEIEDAIEFAHLNITPRGVMSLTILVTQFLISFSILLLFLGYIDLIGGIFIFGFIGMTVYYLYTYPMRLKKIFELKASSEIVMLILHMVIYMRNFPNLEGAVKFASSKLSGPLGLDMKKLLWDVYVGNYNSMEQALISYSQKWKKVFRSFADSINSIVYSLYTGGNRRLDLLDEAVEIILTALDEKSNSYVSKLKTPVVMVNALGILLPTLVLTMLPILTVFLGEEISPILVFGFYDFLLPAVLIFIIKNILDQRVVTLPEPDISLHPNLPPENTFRLGKYYISCYIPAILIFIPFLYYWYLKAFTMNLYESFIVTVGLFLPFVVFFFLNSFQKIKLRKEIIEMEDEFREILFGLGQEMSRGIPIETALEKIRPTLRGHYALNLIQKIISNIRYKGLTLHEAIFNEKEGAILNFPSRLMYSVLKTLVEASMKGTKIVSEIMLSISRYLNNLHRTQENIKEKFSETVSSMHMQAKILLPLITGIMVTLTYVIIEMLNFMEKTMGGLNIEGTATQYMFFLSLWKGVHMTAASFQIAIGIYTLETVMILSWFISGISVGVDKISFYDITYKNLIVGCTLYLLVCLASLIIFQPFIEMIKFGMRPT
jgi:hypothetical protein